MFAFITGNARLVIKHVSKSISAQCTGFFFSDDAVFCVLNIYGNTSTCLWWDVLTSVHVCIMGQ